MLKIGLTGGIGSGKSTVARIFEILGIPVYYADDAAKRIMNEDPALKAAIIQHFGEAAYADGKLNRSWLSAQVFGNPDQTQILNSLVHPATIADAQRWMQSQQAEIAIKEAALIFESGSEKGLDFVIGVSAPEAIRIKRVMARDQVTAETVSKRIHAQMDEPEKMRRCDFIIRNDDTEPVIPQVIELHKLLLQKAALKKQHE